MLNIFKEGDKKYYSKVIEATDTATFETGEVHPVYATFALGRDAEWTCRQFVLDMKEEDEEGIGTFLNVEHLSPAKAGTEINFEASYKNLNGTKLTCSFIAMVNGRLIAKGETGQMILKKNKFERLFENL